MCHRALTKAASKPERFRGWSPFEAVALKPRQARKAVLAMQEICEMWEPRPPPATEALEVLRKALGGSGGFGGPKMLKIPCKTLNHLNG